MCRRNTIQVILFLLLDHTPTLEFRSCFVWFPSHMYIYISLLLFLEVLWFCKTFALILCDETKSPTLSPTFGRQQGLCTAPECWIVAEKSAHPNRAHERVSKSTDKSDDLSFVLKIQNVDHSCLRCWLLITSGGLQRNTYQHLADVCALEESQNSLRQILKAIHKSGAICNFSSFQPRSHRILTSIASTKQQEIKDRKEHKNGKTPKTATLSRDFQVIWGSLPKF